MILHAAEVWIALAVCFVFGVFFGSIVQRTIALTGLRQAQAHLIRVIDRVLLWLERHLVPRRGTVPTILPRTVPVPPPDFGHGLVADEAGLPAMSEPLAPQQVVEMIALDDVPQSSASAPSLVRAVEPSLKHVEAVARGDSVGIRPLALSAPRQGAADPLHLIRGVTKRHAGKLAQVGIFHFSQIASWTPSEMSWIAAYLGAGDTLTSKDWVGQAILFASADEPVRLSDPLPEASAASRKKRQPKKKAVAGSSTGNEPLFRAKPGKRKAPPKSKDQEDRSTEVVSAERSGDPTDERGET